jgi:hypothetical protein
MPSPGLEAGLVDLAEELSHDEASSPAQNNRTKENNHDA